MIGMNVKDDHANKKNKDNVKRFESIKINENNAEPYSFTMYAKETLLDYKQRDEFGKQLLQYQIKTEIRNYQRLLKTFDEMDE